MVWLFDSRMTGPGLSPGQINVWCFGERHTLQPGVKNRYSETKKQQKLLMKFPAMGYLSIQLDYHYF